MELESSRSLVSVDASEQNRLPDKFSYELLDASKQTFRGLVRAVCLTIIAWTTSHDSHTCLAAAAPTRRVVHWEQKPNAGSTPTGRSIAHLELCDCRPAKHRRKCRTRRPSSLSGTQANLSSQGRRLVCRCDCLARRWHRSSRRIFRSACRKADLFAVRGLHGLSKVRKQAWLDKNTCT